MTGCIMAQNDLFLVNRRLVPRLRNALRAHANEGTIGRIRDRTPPLTEYRAMFADDIAAELTFPGDDSTSIEDPPPDSSVHPSHGLAALSSA